ncbi:unnamed protein product [Acanthoscelides obtectus]|uniref:Uncharacterized protein n=1 Tax=Acanthoscelides obtectus TaxID=200917 RepID=A0A9P0NZ24_ACAOB|nr:unnamed protein product [Acanthoscelides obtectus]CAK1679075.1 hypothetical protein AOBTE_LOCUS32115 [Acanthoscelides obtectus]
MYREKGILDLSNIVIIDIE